MGMNFYSVSAYVMCVQVKIIESLDTYDMENLVKIINLMLTLNY